MEIKLFKQKTENVFLDPNEQNGDSLKTCFQEKQTGKKLEQHADKKMVRLKNNKKYAKDEKIAREEFKQKIVFHYLVPFIEEPLDNPTSILVSELLSDMFLF